MSSPYQSLLDSALRAASDTKHLVIGHNNASDVAAVFQRCFPGLKAIVVADTNTFRVCGQRTHDALKAAGIECDEPHVFDDPAIYAEFKYVDQLDAVLEKTNAIPVAVGSGSINDITKLSACHQKRRYMSVATAASMDGYTAYGASITFQGSKQTFECPAPLAVVADLDIIAAAPEGMNASGYADLLAKLPAGADWIVADALGIEPIDPASWEMVQTNLRAWLADPVGVAKGDPAPLESLVAGLMMGGFAMQHLQSSRPASGAEHQFSHLWDMQSHKHNGKSPSHGFKVGIGTLSSAALYEYLYTQSFDDFDVQTVASRWPEWDAVAEEINDLYDIEEIREKALGEAKAKYISPEVMVSELAKLKEVWPDLRERLQSHLPSHAEFADKLGAVGAADHCEKIGISPDRLRLSYRQALHIRRRYTVLDLADRTGVFSPAMDAIFVNEPETLV